MRSDSNQMKRNGGQVRIDPASASPLRCEECGRPFAYVTADGKVVVQSRHGGNAHTNAVAVAELVRLVGYVVASGSGLAA